MVAEPNLFERKRAKQKYGIRYRLFHFQHVRTGLRANRKVIAPIDKTPVLILKLGCESFIPLKARGNTIFSSRNHLIKGAQLKLQTKTVFTF
ncbi:MAG TPA: hypothetical protein DIT95_20050 [Arenibacter sp.]|nr:hypothetical protein [Arenibacter sp.]